MYLLRAGATPGSPQLDDYGPDMTLARELLQRGAFSTVLKYFSSCESFWYNRGHSPLKRWSDEVRQGGIPDFGNRAGTGSKPLKG